MGLFSFVKAAGAALGITSDSESPKAEDVKKELEKHDLDLKDVDIEVDGDKVKIKGKAASQELREKAILTVGNLLGIGSVEDDIATEDEADEAAFHTVEKGDTLWAIAKKHLGDGSKYPAIFEANKPMLSHPDKIYPGQVLRIPKDA